MTSRISLKSLLRLTLLVGALAAVYMGSGSLISQLELPNWSSWILLPGVLIYALALSIPFVPGVELGLGLMVLFGRPGVALVYVGTLLGLSLAFTAGRRLPKSAVISFLDWLHLPVARDGIRELLDASPTEAAARVDDLVPEALGSRLARHRHFLLALAINLPGNVVIGGGGGIALLAGLSGRFRYWSFLMACSAGVAPVPLVFLWVSLRV